MKRTMQLQFSLALLFATIAYAQTSFVPDPDQVVLTDRSRVALGLIFCPCSRSGRGFQASTSASLAAGLVTVATGHETDKRNGVANETATRNALTAAQKAFNECVRLDGYEACVNADFSLRRRFKIQFCIQDKETNKNLGVNSQNELVTVGNCNLRRDTTSPAAKLSAPSSGAGGTPTAPAQTPSTPSTGEPSTPSTGTSSTPPTGTSTTPSTGTATTPSTGTSSSPAAGGEERFPTTSARVKRGFLLCKCSPSQRGFSQTVESMMQRGGKEISDGLEQDQKRGVAQEIIKRKLVKEVSSLLKRCAILYGEEACINFAAASRGEGLSFCTYDGTTSKNLGQSGSDFVTLPKCSASSATRSSAEYLRSQKTETVATNDPQTPQTTPSQTGTDTKPAKGNDGKNGGSISGENVSSANGTNPKIPRKRRNEGCVAVEHLQGYVLQHRKHLLRPVLCSRGFCATPNHGIIVDGTMTSMKHLCSDGGWECTSQVKLVNNLKLSANRRAQVADNIIVTPYDVRFPKIAIWVVQMLEDIWNLLASSVAVGAIAAASGIVVSNMQRRAGEMKDL